nr:glycosyltransferase [Sphingomonas sp.]
MAAVVIGRNEGRRLEASLRSVQDAGLPLVYVDSGSSDGSRDVARSLAVPVLDLDPARPFSAARARNEGLEAVRRRWPETDYVQFLDGDCVLDPLFPSAAMRAFEKEPDCAIITGHLSERSPNGSGYHRLCAIEWQSPAGRIDNFAALGGIMAARVAALLAVGGFDQQVIAGEDSELGVRVALANFSVIKIDQHMAIHDAQMHHFGEWWRRSVRAGHAFAQRYALHGRTRFRDCRRELISAVFWGGAIPMAILLLLWPTRGISLVLLAGYGLLAWRVYRYYLRRGISQSDAALAARFMVYSKFANFLGVLRYCMNRLRGQFRIIEYK